MGLQRKHGYSPTFSMLFVYFFCPSVFDPVLSLFICSQPSFLSLVLSEGIKGDMWKRIHHSVFSFILFLVFHALLFFVFNFVLYIILCFLYCFIFVLLFSFLVCCFYYILLLFVFGCLNCCLFRFFCCVVVVVVLSFFLLLVFILYFFFVLLFFFRSLFFLFFLESLISFSFAPISRFIGMK